MPKIWAFLRKICFDPGIGFHKTVAENLQLLKDPNAFRYQDYPLLYGVSRKRTIGALTNEPEPANRDFGRCFLVCSTTRRRNFTCS